MLPLPEALLLFALHDDTGTVVSSAFLALDHTLRGAILAELRLRGLVQTRADGMMRLHPSPPEARLEPLLARSLALLRAEDAELSVADALTVLERGLPDLRELISTELARRGILGESTISRMGLPDDVAHPSANHEPEAALRRATSEAIDSDRDSLTPRLGTLIGLTVAAHLEEELFEDVDKAKGLADWVAEQDAVLRASREAVERVEGW